MSTDEMIAAWPERWRYPSLLARGSTSLVDGLLHDLAHPVFDAADAVRRTITDGRFGAAESLLDLVPAADCREELESLLRERRQIAGRDVASTAESLRARAAAIEIELSADVDLAELVAVDRRAAEAVLARWTTTVTPGEQKYEQRLLDRLGMQRSVWADAVRTCIQRREFAAARAMLESGSWDEDLAGPASVATGRLWPWVAGYPAATILSWYGGASAPPDFAANWIPPEADTAAWTLIAALKDLVDEVTVTAVRGVATALDQLLGCEGVPHPVNEVGGQFCSEILGLIDPRLGHLDLPRRFTVWITPEGDGRIPDGDPAAVGLSWTGHAGLELTALLALLAPDADLRPLSHANRRINLLRAIYRNAGPALLETSRLCGAHDRVELVRDHLAWTFDLFGVRPESVVLDVLLHELGPQPEALRTVVGYLIERARATGRLVHDDVRRWRNDPEAAEAVRAAVFGALEGDLEVKVIVCAVLSLLGPSTEATLTEQEVYEWIDDGKEFGTAVLVEVPFALVRAVATGLLAKRGENAYGVDRPGLVALLGADRLEAELALAVEELHASWREMVADDDTERQSKILHLLKDERKKLSDTLASLASDDELPESTRARLNRARARGERLDELLVLTQPEEWRTRNRLVSIDLTAFLAKVRRGQSYHSVGVAVQLILPPGDPVVIRGREVTLRMGVDNLVNNAVRAAGEDGTVRMTLSVEGSWLFLDIEDSGPGLPDHVRELIGPGERAGPYEGGRGLRDAFDAITDHGGMVELREEQSPDLGGAWVRVLLPRDGAA